MDADASIAGMVERANDALSAVEDLNARIQAETIGDRSVAALEDERSRWIDRLSELVPVRTAPRGEGRLALYTPGGAILLDGRAATLSFDRTETITPDMTLASGALSGLRMDGRPTVVGTGDGAMDGGALGAQFAVRDRLAPDASARLDALAGDLIRRFESPGADPTLTPGDAGLFTDAGLPLDPSDQVGLAGRIAVNASADPAAGGDAWRIRDGMAAAAPGPVGEDAIPRGMLAALDTVSSAPAGAGLSGRYAFPALVEAVSAGGLRAEADAAAEAAYADGRLSTFAEAEAAATGVDGDREMSDLLAVEQAYAANARVIETVDGLLRRLLEIR
jgi:flagellar hook-associated protein 1 FlgK